LEGAEARKNKYKSPVEACSPPVSMAVTP